MPKPMDSIARKLPNLRVGPSRFISKPRLSGKTLRKHSPQSAWRSEAREGGLMVTRFR